MRLPWLLPMSLVATLVALSACGGRLEEPADEPESADDPPDLRLPDASQDRDAHASTGKRDGGSADEPPCRKACGAGPDASRDATALADASVPGDAAPPADSSVQSDAASSLDASSPLDAATYVDASPSVDASDASAALDASTSPDASPPADASVIVDGSVDAAPPPPPPALVWYRFDELVGRTAVNSGTSGPTLDGVVGANVGIGAVGRSGTAFHFDGSPSSVVTVTNLGATALDLQGAWTVELWIKPDVIKERRTILAKWDGAGNGYYVELYQGFVHTVTCKDDRCAVGVAPWPRALTVLRWYHVALVKTPDGDEGLYLDGTRYPGNGNTPLAANGLPLTIGGGLVGGVPTGSFKGSLDEIKIWELALTPAQICVQAGGTLGPSGCRP